jgi:hypothetical protein
MVLTSSFWFVLLLSCRVIRTMPYSLEEMTHILSIRAEAEGIEVEDEALTALGEVRPLQEPLHKPLHHRYHRGHR